MWDGPFLEQRARRLGSDLEGFVDAYITSRSGVEIRAEDIGRVSSHQAAALCGALAFQQVVVEDDTFPSDFEHEPALSLIVKYLQENVLVASNRQLAL